MSMSMATRMAEAEGEAEAEAEGEVPLDNPSSSSDLYRVLFGSLDGADVTMHGGDFDSFDNPPYYHSGGDKDKDEDEDEEEEEDDALDMLRARIASRALGSLREIVLVVDPGSDAGVGAGVGVGAGAGSHGSPTSRKGKEKACTLRDEVGDEDGTEHTSSSGSGSVLFSSAEIEEEWKSALGRIGVRLSVLSIPVSLIIIILSLPCFSFSSPPLSRGSLSGSRLGL